MISSIIDSVRNLFHKINRDGKETQPPPSVPLPQHPEAVSQPARNTSRSAPSPGNGGESPPRRPRRRKRSPAGNKRSSEPSARADSIPVQKEPDAAGHLEPWDPDQYQVPVEEGKIRFHDLDIPPEILRAVSDLGFMYCTPIQAELLPKALQGRDVAGRAQTGTGKTAVFLISIISHLIRKPASESRRKGRPRAFILAPTRELVLQIERDAKALARYTPLNIVSVFGGMDYEKQKQMLKGKAVDIVAATPGRLLDFERHGDIGLDRVEILVIDEADRMLDMGFIPDVQKIIGSTPPKTRRQTMFFSATLTPQIMNYAERWTRDSFLAEIESEQMTAETINQLVYITTMEEKFPLLYNLITGEDLERVIVFTNRRDQARRLTEQFTDHGINSALLSGEVEQKKRVKTLEGFRNGNIRVLVATDVAARGLHIDGVSHVINYNLPLDPEDYVHRIGRTGRAGLHGTSVSFASEDDSFQIPGIEKFIGRRLPCVYPEEEWLKAPPPPRAIHRGRQAVVHRKPHRRGTANRGRG